MLLLVVVLLMVVVVDYSRSRVVRRMVVGRRQALRRVGMMLRASKVSDAASVTVVKDRSRCAQ
jgi:hypothetical protein